MDRNDVETAWSSTLTLIPPRLSPNLQHKAKPNCGALHEHSGGSIPDDSYSTLALCNKYSIECITDVNVQKII